MCKIFAMLNTSTLKEKKLDLIKSRVAQIYGLSNKDGFGEINVNFVGENVKKWSNIKHAIKRVTKFIDTTELSFFEKVISNETGEYTSYGQIEGSLNAIVCHARFATRGEKTVDNAHPFSKENVHLIHNGVISADRKYTVDSEAILDYYLEEKLDGEINETKLVSFFGKILGSAACVAVNNEYVDVFLGAGSSLGVAIVEIAGNKYTCFATSTSDLKLIFHKIGKVIAQAPLDNYSWIRYDRNDFEKPKEAFKLDAYKVSLAKKENESYAFVGDNWTERTFKYYEK